MLSTYSNLEPVLEVLHTVFIVVPSVVVPLDSYDVHLFLPGTCSGGPPRWVYCCSSYSCLPAPIMMSTYSYLEPVLEVLHAVSTVLLLLL